LLLVEISSDNFSAVTAEMISVEINLLRKEIIKTNIAILIANCDGLIGEKCALMDHLNQKNFLPPKLFNILYFISRLYRCFLTW